MIRFIPLWLGTVMDDWGLRTGSQETVLITFSIPLSSLLSFVASHTYFLSFSSCLLFGMGTKVSI